MLFTRQLGTPERRGRPNFIVPRNCSALRPTGDCAIQPAAASTLGPAAVDGDELPFVG